MPIIVETMTGVGEGREGKGGWNKDWGKGEGEARMQEKNMMMER